MTTMNKCIRDATKAAFDAVTEVYNNNEGALAEEGMRTPDFVLTVAARFLTCVLQSGKAVLESDMTDEVLANIKKDLEEFQDDDMAAN